MPETPVERHVCVQDSPVRAPRQIGSVKFNVIHFIEPSTIHRPRTHRLPWNVLHVRETISGLRVAVYSHRLQHVTNAVDQSIRVFVPRGWTNYAPRLCAPFDEIRSFLMERIRSKRFRKIFERDSYVPWKKFGKSESDSESCKWDENPWVYTLYFDSRNICRFFEFSNIIQE